MIHAHVHNRAELDEALSSGVRVVYVADYDFTADDGGPITVKSGSRFYGGRCTDPKCPHYPGEAK